MDRQRGEGAHPDDYMYHHPNWSYDNHRPYFSGDFHHHHHHHHHHHQQQQHPPPAQHQQQDHYHYQGDSPNHPHSYQQNNNSFSEPNYSTGDGLHTNSNPGGLPCWPRKRQFSSECSDGVSFVKLYVSGVPRTSTEDDIRAVFGVYGHIVEVVLIKDKRTGQQGETCFVKYATLEEADRALEATNSQYTFPGGVLPIKVRYAEGERERLGNFYGTNIHKLYVGCLSKEATKRELEEIFSPFGVLEDVFVARNELKQNRGFGFVQFSRREMAVAALNALNGTYVMKGSDQPLNVRFADPKRPKTGDSMPRPFSSGPLGGHLPPNNNSGPLSQRVPSSSQSPQSQPQAVSNSCPAPEQVGPPPISAVCEDAETDKPLDCKWSEHVYPDGDAYYYNCITCESRWEKPEEYAVYEQELEKLEQQYKTLGGAETVSVSVCL